MLRRPNAVKCLIEYYHYRETNGTAVDDIHNATHHRRYRIDWPLTDCNCTKPDGEYHLHITFTGFTDGVQPFDRGGASIWPLFLVFDDLPLTMRFKEEWIVVASIYEGTPIFDAWLSSYVEAMNELSLQGVELGEVDGKRWVVYPEIYQHTGDIPAIRYITSLGSCHGTFGCACCFASASSIQKSATGKVQNINHRFVNAAFLWHLPHI